MDPVAANSSVRSIRVTARTQLVPPYSIVTLKLAPSATNPVSATLSASGGPTVDDVAATSTTISWRPATCGSVTRYADRCRPSAAAARSNRIAAMTGRRSRSPR
jgi:hypothetical protein